MVTRSQSSRPKLSKWMEDGRPHSSFFFFIVATGVSDFPAGHCAKRGDSERVPDI